MSTEYPQTHPAMAVARNIVDLERAEIQAAADASGSAWLRYMALRGEPEMLPANAWARALRMSRKLHLWKRRLDGEWS